MSARHWLIEGRVQGVGFRAFVERQASRRGLAGWVRNLRDGRVEVLAEGPEEELDRLASVLREGPPGSRVDELEERSAASSPELEGNFEVRSTVDRPTAGGEP